MSDRLLGLLEKQQSELESMLRVQQEMAKMCGKLAPPRQQAMVRCPSSRAHVVVAVGSTVARNRFMV